jgi:hypothetical protein
LPGGVEDEVAAQQDVVGGEQAESGMGGLGYQKAVERGRAG